MGRLRLRDEEINQRMACRRDGGGECIYVRGGAEAMVMADAWSVSYVRPMVDWSLACEGVLVCRWPSWLRDEHAASTMAFRLSALALCPAVTPACGESQTRIPAVFVLQSFSLSATRQCLARCRVVLACEGYLSDWRVRISSERSRSRWSTEVVRKVRCLLGALFVACPSRPVEESHQTARFQKHCLLWDTARTSVTCRTGRQSWRPSSLPIRRMP